jgi:hypothetical protein
MRTRLGLPVAGLTAQDIRKGSRQKRKTRIAAFEVRFAGVDDTAELVTARFIIVPPLYYMLLSALST